MDTVATTVTLDNPTDAKEIDSSNSLDNLSVTTETAHKTVAMDTKPVTTDTESDAGSVEYTMDDILDNISGDEQETTLVANDPLRTDTDKEDSVLQDSSKTLGSGKSDTDAEGSEPGTTDTEKSDLIPQESSIETMGIEKSGSSIPESSTETKKSDSIVPGSPTETDKCDELKALDIGEISTELTSEQVGSWPMSDKHSDECVDSGDDMNALGNSAKTSLEKSSQLEAVDVKADNSGVTLDGGEVSPDKDVCEKAHDDLIHDPHDASNKTEEDDSGQVLTESACQSTVTEHPCADPEKNSSVPTAVANVTEETTPRDSNKTDDEKLNIVGDNLDDIEDLSQENVQNKELYAFNETKKKKVPTATLR